MKYFIVEDSLDEKVVGKDFPQAYSLSKDIILMHLICYLVYINIENHSRIIYQILMA